MPVLTSGITEGVMGLVIVMNAAFLGVDIHLRMTAAIKHDHLSNATEWALYMTRVMFLIIFLAEIILRISVERKDFLIGPNNRWNIFETFCVLSMAVEVLNLETICEVVGQASTLRILRILRIARAVRLVRVFQFFKELRLMLYSVLACVASLFWALTLLFLEVYLFSLYYETLHLTP